MVLVMMKKCRCNAFVLFILFFSSFNLFSQNYDNWILAAQEFNYSGNTLNTVSSGIKQMFPSRILEKVSTSLLRTISPDEFIERQLYELKNERTSLFLQYSAQVQIRDSLFLNAKYTKKELDKKLKEEDQKLADIKKQIELNLQKQKQLLTINDEATLESSLENNTEGLYTKEDLDKLKNQYGLEKIHIYKDDYLALFVRDPKNINLNFENQAVQNEFLTNKINSVITGNIKLIDNYVVVTVEVYAFPGGKKIASVKEYGALDDADLVCTSIARQITPQIINSLPVNITLTIEPQEIKNQTTFFIDDILQKEIPNNLQLSTGVHYLQFSCPGYKTLSTTYAFNANQSYNIRIKMTEEVSEKLILDLQPLKEGTFYAQGIPLPLNEENKPYIMINGKSILGEFLTVSEDKDIITYFYIPQEKINSQIITFDLNPFDKEAYIEKRRRWMYTSYSALITSLIPTFYLDGQVDSYHKMAALGMIRTQEDINTANNWTTASNISKGVSIGCGVWFIYELVRYLYAANTILPEEL